MAVFAVVLNEPSDAVTERLKAAYPEPAHYQLTDTFFLVQSPTLAETIAVTVGIKGEKRVNKARGAVFRLSLAYAGYTSRTLWEWLEQAEGRE